MDRRGSLAVGVGVGLVLGAAAGAAVRGSGSIYDNLLFIGAFLAVLLGAAAGAVAATRADRRVDARGLTAFIGASIVASVAAYAVAPPYRSPDAPDIATGRLAVRVTAPEALGFDGAARCTIEHGRAYVSHVVVLSARAWQRDVVVLLDPGVPDSGSLGKLTLSFSSPRGGSDYTSSVREGLTPLTSSPDGRSGSFTFVADRVEAPARSPDPVFEQIAGTVEWACR